MWKTLCKHVHPDHIEIGLGYVADASMWPKQQGGIGLSSGAFQRFHVLVVHAQGMTSGKPGGTYLQLLYLLEGG